MYYTTSSTLDILYPIQSRNAVKSLVIVITASLLIAFLAQIQIPMYPVPLTLQPFAVVLISLVFPWRLALGAVLSYIAMAAVGLPVLVGFKGGLAWPVLGYILGYIPLSIIISVLTQYWAKENTLKRFVSVVLGYSVQFMCGFLILSQFVGYETAFQTGILPFLFADFGIKNLLAVLLSNQIHLKLKKKQKS